MQPGAGRPFVRKRLRYDQSLFLELSLCHEWGIPHSQFLEWDPEDRAKAIAFSMARNEICDLCGTGEWEWNENRRAYTPTETFCMGCYQKSLLDEGGSLPGSSVTLVKTGSYHHAKIMAAQSKALAFGRDQ